MNSHKKNKEKKLQKSTFINNFGGLQCRRRKTMHRGAGDGGFVLHESFKDLKTRRAEQEAYRKALEEQITQRKKLQQEDSDR